MSLSARLKLSIDGMTCTGCASRLQTALNAIEGINAEVTFASKRAEFTIDESVDYDDTVKSIQILIEQKGYKTALSPEDDALNNSHSEQAQSSTGKDSHSSQVKTQELLVEGATCASCVSKIEKALNDLPDVQQAQMNFALRTVSITGNVDTETLIQTIESVGYNAKSTDNASDEKLLDEKEKAEQKYYQKLILQMWLGLGLGGPLMIYGLMGGPMTVNSPIERAVWLFIGLICAAVMYFAGKHFYIGAWKSFVNHNANMDTLIALGTGTAWLYSMFVVIYPLALPDMARHVYFEATAMIIGLINLGLALEVKARGRTSEAIQRLIGLKSKTARVIRDGKDIDIALEQVLLNDLIRVRPGERIPVDGTVNEGKTTIDE